MACHLNYSSLSPSLNRTPTGRVPSLSPLWSWSTIIWKKCDGRKINRWSWSRNDQNKSPPVFATTTKTDTYSIHLKTLDGCKFCISRYSFEYNGEGGQGIGSSTKVKYGKINENISVSFYPKTVCIPSISTVTTKFHGLPFPPFLRIDVVPESLEGTINEETGKVDLKLRANFLFSAGNAYKAPPLLVNTALTSEESKGNMFQHIRGKRVTRNGKCRLVGVTKLGRTEDPHINYLLNLPSECLTDLNAIISFCSDTK